MKREWKLGDHFIVGSNWENIVDNRVFQLKSFYNEEDKYDITLTEIGEGLDYGYTYAALCKFGLYLDNQKLAQILLEQ